jgi:hypothetical protein
VNAILKINALKVCTLLGALVVTGCVTTPPTRYSPELAKEYRAIFTQVLHTFVASKPGPNICLPPLFGFGDTVSDTTEVMPDLGMPTQLPGSVPDRAKQLKALESAGLVSSTESTRTINNRVQKVLTYRRTTKGLASSQGPSVCYARGELDQVVKWKGPAVLGEYQAAFVYYTVKTTHVEDWAKSADIQSAFPTTVPIVTGDVPKVREAVIDLSSAGWDIAEYSRYVQLQ